MSLAATGVRLGGVPATEIAPHSPPTWETLADGGNGSASFEFGRSARFAPHVTAPGTLMEIMVGPQHVWLGRVQDYDRNSGELVGRGIQVDANSIPALDGSLNVTRSTAVALTTATASPWNYYVTNPIGYGGTASGDSSSPMMVAELLNLVATEQGARWGQTPRAVLYMLPDPTVPTWTIVPGAAAFGATSEGQATHLVARYFNGTDFVTTLRENGASVAVAEIVDLTGDEYGAMTQAQVWGILDAMLEGSRSKMGWVNGVTLHREQITFNGTPAFLPSIHARSRMVRAAVPTVFGSSQAPWVDVALGKTRYTAGSDVIYLEPVNKAPRTLADVIAAA